MVCRTAFLRAGGAPLHDRRQARLLLSTGLELVGTGPPAAALRRGGSAFGADH